MFARAKHEFVLHGEDLLIPCPFPNCTVTTNQRQRVQSVLSSGHHMLIPKKTVHNAQRLVTF